jgi:PAS domain S-box-containing protein
LLPTSPAAYKGVTRPVYELMSKRLSSILGIGLGASSWPMALIGIVAIKAVLLLAVKQGSFVMSYSGISYFLLLVLATSFALRNAVENTLRGRLFWTLLAIAFGVWAADQWCFLYYEFGRHIEVPRNSVGDSLLFLHIVPLLAALATLPHRNLSDRTSYRAILNALLLALFWVFLYSYIVFPYQYLFKSTTPFGYALRFDTLYALENVTLVLVLAFLTRRAEAPWKSVYLHLLGASALYAVSSTVANIATDSGGYLNGKLYGLGLTASVCWFVWVPLCAHQVPAGELKAMRADGSRGSQASVWAMLVVVMISIPIVWELFQRDENPALRTLRLLIAIATIIGLASAAYIREYLGRRELASHLGLADDRLRLAMEAGKSAGWDWDIRSGRETWFGDLKTIFGIPSTHYACTVGEFRSRIHPEDREKVSKAVSDARHNHQPYAARFRLLWPGGTVRWVAAKGEFHYSRDGEAERMMGTAVDITDQRRMAEALRESEERLRLAAETGRMYAFEWDVVTDALEQSAESVSIGTGKPIRTTGQQMMAQVHPDDRRRVAAAMKQPSPEKPICKVVYRVLGPEGSITWVEATGRGFFDQQGEMLRLVGMVADANERKLAEEALSSVSRRVIEAEEQERSRIARELHEDIGQRIALLAIEIDQFKTDASCQTADAQNRMEAVWRRTLEILADVKASAHELHSPRLDYLGIAAVMRCFCREFGERKKVEIDFQSESLPSLIEPEISVCLFRVLQEALYNGTKHSGVAQFGVRLWGASDEIHLAISDSGAGFDREVAMNGNGSGLIRARERLKLLNGAFSVESRPNRGTTLHASVPLKPYKSMRAAG